jgi:hypothetical protein
MTLTACAVVGRTAAVQTSGRAAPAADAAKLLAVDDRRAADPREWNAAFNRVD